MMSFLRSSRFRISSGVREEEGVAEGEGEGEALREDEDVDAVGGTKEGLEDEVPTVILQILVREKTSENKVFFLPSAHGLPTTIRRW